MKNDFLSLALLIATSCAADLPVKTICTQEICTDIYAKTHPDLEKYIHASHTFVLENKDRTESEYEALSKIFDGLKVDRVNYCSLDLKQNIIYWNSNLEAPRECWSKSLAVRWFYVEHRRMPLSQEENNGKREDDFQKKWNEMDSGINWHLRNLYGNQD